MKRVLDVATAIVGLTVLLPLIAIVSLLIKLDSGAPVLFRQERVGRRFRPFVIYKFRTMTTGAANPRFPISVGDDPRVTRLGRVLRMLKIDEVPQLFNVLKGDMSLVGPRPELAQFVELFRADYADILEARPGITDLASIKYRNEAELLAAADDPEAEYVNRILPDKIRLAREYLRQSSVGFDLAIIARTFFRVVGWKTAA